MWPPRQGGAPAPRPRGPAPPTTPRLIPHTAARAGRRVGMTNSDGIYRRGALVEAGDWTGFGGAARVLSEPGIDLAVLETARGGILLRGIGYARNDVSVVTNVSADHLGLQGVETVEEWAEVKAAVTRITRRGGWAVLNAEDPLVWAMRRESRARRYAFSLDPQAPGVEAALDRGGRAALRSFSQDTDTSPGRLNLFERDGVLALVDFAHNEAGLVGLLEVCRSLAGVRREGRRRGQVRLAVGP